jgi:hypothetical protein
LIRNPSRFLRIFSLQKVRSMVDANIKFIGKLKSLLNGVVALQK